MIAGRDLCLPSPSRQAGEGTGDSLAPLGRGKGEGQAIKVAKV